MTKCEAEGSWKKARGLGLNARYCEAKADQNMDQNIAIGRNYEGTLGNARETLEGHWQNTGRTLNQRGYKGGGGVSFQNYTKT